MPPLGSLFSVANSASRGANDSYRRLDLLHIIRGTLKQQCIALIVLFLAAPAATTTTTTLLTSCAESVDFQSALNLPHASLLTLLTLLLPLTSFDSRLDSATNQETAVNLSLHLLALLTFLTSLRPLPSHIPFPQTLGLSITAQY